MNELEHRVSLLADRLGRFPDRKFFQLNEPLRALLHGIEQQSALEDVYEALGGDAYFDERTIDIPSQRQVLVASTIAHDGFMHNRKKLEMSIPGSQKTGGVLIAADLINRTYMPQLAPDRRLKTLYASPGFLVSTMMDEARKFLPSYNMVGITRNSRQEDIRRAADPSTDIVFLGYELSFRKTGGNHRPADARQFYRLAADMPTMKDVERRLETMVKAAVISEKQLERFSSKRLGWYDALQWIAQQQEKFDSAAIFESLREHVFTPEQPYYVIMGEAHNIVDFESRTAEALSGLFRNARWGVLETGTAVRNTPEQMGYLMYLLGFVDDPKHFARAVKSEPARVRTALQLYAMHPVITDLKQIDPNVAPLTEHPPTYYHPDQAVIDTYVALMGSTLFTGTERLELYRKLLAAPNLLPKVASEKPFHKRIQQFFDGEPGLADQLVNTPNERLAATRRLAEEAIARGEKVLIVCDHKITDYVAHRFADLNFRKINDSLSVQINGEGISPRDAALLEAATNPDVHGIVTTYGTMREGKDGREFTTIIEYEGTTVPFEHTQLIARAHRSGQRTPVNLHKVHAEGIELDDSIVAFRDWKQGIARKVYENANPTQEEIEAYINDISPQSSPQLRPLLMHSSRSRLALIFASLVEKGSAGFADAMLHGENARLLAAHFNHQWEQTYSANCAKLMQSVVQGLEREHGKLERIIDAAAGPATVARTLHRPTTTIDLLPIQLEYGRTACAGSDARSSTHYVGSIHDLRRLVPLESIQDPVFIPGKDYENMTAIQEGSHDLYVCSLAFHYLTPHERRDCIAEANRVLRPEGQLLLLMPRSKIAPESESTLLHDIEACGFAIDVERSGEYAAEKAYNIDTGKQFSGRSFSPYIIVARKHGEPTQQETAFMLKPPYVIKEESLLIAEHRERGRKARLLFDEFYRKHPPVGYVPNIVEELPPTPECTDQLSEMLTRLSEALNDA